MPPTRLRPEINTVVILLAAAVACGSASTAAGAPLSAPLGASRPSPPARSINAPPAAAKQPASPPQEDDSSSAEEIARRATASAGESADAGTDPNAPSETAYDVLAR